MKKVINMINPSSKVAGVSLVELKKTEKALGAIFPDEYKELFLETNGAKFGDWTLFPIQTNEQTALTIDIVKQNQNRPKNLASDMVCIGEKVSGDKLCYRIRKRFMQELIYTWNDKTGLGKYASLSLSEFIDRHVPKVNTNKPNKLGTFMVESGKLIVTDPYYKVDEEAELQIVLLNVKNGNWTASISYTPDEVVKNLFVFYGEKKPSGKWHVCDKQIGVDSAQAGIFDFKTFGRNEAIQFDEVVASDAQGGVVSDGAVSMSGYGDGMYEVKVKYNISKKVVGVMIDFVDEE
ncbi:SMI1/KNR4 family protein [Bacillus sp. AFS076308]|uniref:SMI1/KNR4 family protein n=1 Tax=unclassified Bacillus (in: firmicutes) TaxID=185979 RepID=UPI000BF76496|nr:MULTISPECIES: SMI1/KNR4 family protein [unclassified Bacillus (in: firmicutes)]PFN82201.1 SMI1/KNR4 family protein [Bacillus sp. AFS076308]PGV45902.1 SMI1/KNR4 family protein [Bacillus sp. AFS037270]